MGTHPIFESDFDCLTDMIGYLKNGSRIFFAFLIFSIQNRLPFGSNLFSFHLMLMTCATWMFLEAIFIRKSSLSWKSKNLVHLVISLLGSISLGSGFWAIYERKNIISVDYSYNFISFQRAADLFWREKFPNSSSKIFSHNQLFIFYSVFPWTLFKLGSK